MANHTIGDLIFSSHHVDCCVLRREYDSPFATDSRLRNLKVYNQMKNKNRVQITLRYQGDI